MPKDSPAQDAATAMAAKARHELHRHNIWANVRVDIQRIDGYEMWQARIDPRILIQRNLDGEWSLSAYWRFASDPATGDTFLSESSMGLNVDRLGEAADWPESTSSTCLVRYDFVAGDTLSHHLNVAQFSPLRDEIHWRIPWPIIRADDAHIGELLDWLLSDSLELDLRSSGWTLPPQDG